ncbi:MAG: MFS transporter [Pseudomonadales bacterium RIFCSPLOWO2_12_60_38]|uniref:Major facilitator superfamily (MFS) profile domain-containing protein n=2 Tax=Pseudomonas TaxID=286 RepID=A0A3M5WBG4_PSESX|nr:MULTISPECIES: MFS transporter [Pseudomonas]AFJ55619.1 transporter, major facilitator family [Pseudomonas fluorescens A506]AOS74599.1 MFS transporter [Pseudomonas fluorescens]ETK39885.1 major facilitator transporter [Pseudomonas fluorescens FH5]MDN5402311.1 MFS transporter [Pseudomonas sp.]MDN5431581.1 MFS transporter [Pseudomonadales bacterium]NLT86451.1 MFS transporter [Pseudomonas lactis]OHC32040.1 MAG: MFS transporter [Pseudomonadales bacterium RIFCSPLOWO2_12_60_38]OHC41447.1 MAG: MFS
MDKYTPHTWQPHERPSLPGSPSTPLHPTHKRWLFALVGVLVAITGGLGNALVIANLQYLQGALGATTAEMAWLPAAYVMTNVCMNLLLVKFRQQFGLRAFTEVFLVLYALVTFGHLFVNDLSSAIAVRAAHGMVGAALSSLGLYYMIQAFPAKWRLKALVLGLGTAQLALPLARLFSEDLLQIAEWRGLYLFELGLALICLGCVFLLKLPPGDRFKTFEKLDFLTFAILASGVALLCAVLSLGRIDWWLEAPWIGVASACSLVLIMAGLAIEHNRSNPMLMTRWLGSGVMIRLALAVVLIRMVLSEQSTGAVGFMQMLNMSYQQMHTLYVVMLAGAIAGLVVSALTINPAHLLMPLIISLALMATGSVMDSFSSNLTRPQNLYISQFLLGFGGTFFLGPTMVLGTKNVLTNPRNLVSFSVMFGICQNLGGLIGAALLGTFQIVREKYHSSMIVEHLTLIDPLVAARVQSGGAAYGKIVADPELRNLMGIRSLATAATREANVMAYNDVFMLIAIIAILTMLWIFTRSLWLMSTTKATPPVQPSGATS